jgi:hypothetical protein
VLPFEGGPCGWVGGWVGAGPVCVAGGASCVRLLRMARGAWQPLVNMPPLIRYPCVALARPQSLPPSLMLSLPCPCRTAAWR